MILAVDDDPIALTALHRLLDDSCKVLEARDGLAALAVIAHRDIDVVLLDLMLDGVDGVTFLEQVARLQKDVRVVVVSAIREPSVVATAMRLGAFDYLTKPFEDQELLAVISDAIGRRPHRRPDNVLELRRRGRVLFVEREPARGVALAVLLAGSLSVEIVSTADDLMWALRNGRPDVIVANGSAPDSRAAELLALVDLNCWLRPVILVGRHDLRPTGEDSRIYTRISGDAGMRELINAIANVLPRDAMRPADVSDATLGVINYVVDHLADADVHSLGRAVGRSAYNLSRPFRADTGMSIKTFLNRLRVEAAKVLLRATDDKLETIATRLGLHDASHLSRLCLRHIGVRPGDLRLPPRTRAHSPRERWARHDALRGHNR